MAIRANVSIACTAFLTSALLAVPAFAETIGWSVSVENQVTGTYAGATRTLNEGNDVFSNDLISTKAASLARLTFRDNTNLSIGPSSAVKLDRFVFNPNESAGSVVLNASRGAFRFVTGNSDPRTFKINTPVATIGIRGTVLDIRHQGPETIVVLKRGASHVCVLGSVSKCADLTLPNQYVIVRKTGITGPLEGGSSVFEFKRFCTEGHMNHFDACDIGERFNSIVPEYGHGGGGQPVNTAPAPKTNTSRSSP